MIGNWTPLPRQSGHVLSTGNQYVRAEITRAFAANISNPNKECRWKDVLFPVYFLK
jgi:hypothetical protein